MSSFAELKNSRNSFEKLKKAIAATAVKSITEGSREDTRFWQPETDKAGNGMAIIRFLPAPPVDGNDSLPWVRVWNHGFQGPGGWYIENSLTTLGQKDPVSEYNSVLWNSGVEANKEIARKQKRRLTYIANIMVISDSKNPENEGQLRLYKFGKKVYEKIDEAMNPKFEDETPINPTDFWEGANFKLKIRKVEGYRNYDKCEFDKPSALFDGDDDKLEALFKEQFSLKEFIDPKQFKSYEFLKTKLDKVLGLDGVTPVNTKAETSVVPKETTTDTDDEMDYFKSLADD